MLQNIAPQRFFILIIIFKLLQYAMYISSFIICKIFEHFFSTPMIIKIVLFNQQSMLVNTKVQSIEYSNIKKWALNYLDEVIERLEYQ